MLMISIQEAPSEQKWILQGRLAGPWAAELISNWKRTRTTRDGRKCVVDLSNVTFIDRAGEEILRAMKEEGSQFITCGVNNRYVLRKVCRAARLGRAARKEWPGREKKSE